MIPEKKAVTKTEESILSPLWRAAAFVVTQQQVLKVSCHGAVESGETDTLKMPEGKKKGKRKIDTETCNTHLKQWTRKSVFLQGASLLFHPFPLCCRFDAWRLQTEDSFQELVFAAGEVQEDGVTQHGVERVGFQQHGHVTTSNTDLGGQHFI